MADNTTNSNDRSATGGYSSTTTYDTTSSLGGAFAPSVEREGFSNHPHFDGYEGRTVAGSTSFNETMNRYVGDYDRSLRANPYLHIGLAGAGALLLGYVLGKSVGGSRISVRSMSDRYSDIEEGYDE